MHNLSSLQLSYATLMLAVAALFEAPPVLAQDFPTDGLILWLDANDIDANPKSANPAEPNASVAKWWDKSKQRNHVQQTRIDQRPTLHLNGINNRYVVRFDGNDLLDRDQFVGLKKGDQPFHFLVVMQASNQSAISNQRIMDLSSRDKNEDPAARQSGFWLGYQGNRKLVRLGIAYGDEGEAPSVVWNGKPNLVEAVYGGRQKYRIHFNGATDKRDSYRQKTFLGFRGRISFALGQHYKHESHVPTFYQGDMAEVLLYNRSLSRLERNRIGLYLTKKYALKTNFRPIRSFEKDVRPIFVKHCHQCHGQDTQEAELDLRTVAGMLRGGKAGPVIVPGFPDRSEIVGLIDSGKMPPDDKPRLTSAEIQVIRDWITNDALSNEKRGTLRPLTKISDEDRAHWAYQKLKHHAPPLAADSVSKKRVKNEIDNFILSKLSRNKLTFSDQANTTTLIRRAFFDLTGLPPSVQDIDEFEANWAKVPDLAYEQLVDQLLRSPHFGERFGRYWLDVSGYVDVHGSDNDAAIIKTLDSKWRYRDYVIRAFNQDKPFDQFIVEQLAGDELHDWRSAEQFTDEMVEALTATSFLLCANDDTSAKELNTLDIRHHVLQRTTEIVASNLLALTVQCAKCHDHKYEAIPQVDYYALESVFAPAFNVERWITATSKSRADVSDREKDKIDQLNKEIQQAIAKLSNSQTRIRETYRQRLFEEKLSTVPEAMQKAVRSAMQTAANKRNAAQKKLTAKYEATLKVTPKEIETLLNAADRKQLEKLALEKSKLESNRRSYGQLQIVHEAAPPTANYLLRRGNFLKPGIEVPPSLIGILVPPQPDDSKSIAPRTSVLNPKSSGRRLALARQLTDGNSLAGQHVARVIVNRLWQQVFGQGIVRTSDNFGVSGEKPSHPELLDWLTLQFIKNGWQVKPILKLMMTSATYRQVSTAHPDVPASRIDPENRLLWRMSLRRLDSESIRDAMLATSGKLDRTLFGSPIPLDVRPDGRVIVKTTGLPTPTYHHRRSIYVLARRNYHLTMLRLFDQPIVARNCTVRKSSTVVTQSLALLHDDFVIEQARSFAERINKRSNDPSKQKIALAFRIAFGREPTGDELNLCGALIVQHEQRYSKSGKSLADANHLALCQLCQTLMNTNEFLYLH